jgi:predicted RNA-binding protein Jag
MNAFERRIIHAELSKRSDVKTESVGEGEERRVAIKPV